MTPESLLAHLENLPPDAPLVFRTDQGPIGGGYHVTELKLARINSVDCGARRSEWTEASLQLLDGTGGRHMTVEKFAAILVQSIRHVPGLGPAPLTVEFGHGNRSLQILSPVAPSLEGDEVVVTLGDSSAVCKPVRDAMRIAPAEERCCGSTASACCG